ncbi:hypothetical protein [Peterkaempfera bronchialis]|uniref:Uncharacterized protein n=1 Tax=Peterkaempfera bronchialis TaxID=2126346 RepID=A0A345T0Z3_9ACTN|nr:hypothetical protein [Peterkaempfera bronchialis]AXI79648.1 hypothetical protein C7M71_021800 [Peterkaempfera bronchialis]
MAARNASAHRPTGRSDEPAAILGPGHAELLEILLPVCVRHHLALAGGPAARAHGLGTPAPRTEELELATGESTPVAAIADAVAHACRDAGCVVAAQPPGTALLANLLVTPPYEPSSRPIGVTVVKKPLAHPPVWMDAAGLDSPVPFVSAEDAACMTLVALTDRTVPGDLLTVHSMADRFTPGELLAMASSFDEDFRPGALAERLDKLAGLDDEAYQRYGTAVEDVGEVKRWALAWAHDITLDLLEGREDPDAYYDSPDPDAPPGPADDL